MGVRASRVACAKARFATSRSASARVFSAPAASADERARLPGVDQLRAQVKCDRVFEAVVTPEQLLAREHRGRAEDAVHDCPLILLAQTLLVLRRFRAREYLARRLADGGEDLRDSRGLGNLAVLGKVGTIDSAHEARAPGLFGRHTGDPRREQSAA